MKTTAAVNTMMFVREDIDTLRIPGVAFGHIMDFISCETSKRCKHQKSPEVPPGTLNIRMDSF